MYMIYHIFMWAFLPPFWCFGFSLTKQTKLAKNEHPTSIAQVLSVFFFVGGILSLWKDHIHYIPFIACDEIYPSKLGPSCMQYNLWFWHPSSSTFLIITRTLFGLMTLGHFKHRIKIPWSSSDLDSVMMDHWIHPLGMCFAHP